jgi:hypothetical protein
MSYQRSTIAAACLVTTLIMQSFLFAEEKLQPDPLKKGTDLGNYIPTTTTWIVLSPTLPNYNGNNTCLAGVYRNEKTISIYAQTSKMPFRADRENFWNMLQAVDHALLEHPELKVYVVINERLRAADGANFSKARFLETLTRAQRKKFKRLDVSLCRSPSKYLFDQETPVKFVYSEKRLVKMSKKLTTTEQALKDVPALIAEVIKLSAAQ